MTATGAVHSFIKSFRVGGADNIWRRYLRKDGGRDGRRKKDAWRKKKRKRKRAKRSVMTSASERAAASVIN